MNSVTLVFPDFVKHNDWIRTYRLNTILAFLDFTQLNFCSISSLDTNTWTFNLTYFAPNYLRLSTYTLHIDSNQLAIKNVWILNDDSIIPLGNDMHSSLFEIGELCIWTLEIRIDRNYSSGVISLVSDKFTTYQIYWSGRKTYQACEFLIQFIWDWL